jgi:hypothetical protein
MNYLKIGKMGFLANPQNWEELRWTLHNEKGMVKIDPNLPPDQASIERGKALYAKFS